jgi:hypothetical protein
MEQTPLEKEKAPGFPQKQSAFMNDVTKRGLRHPSPSSHHPTLPVPAGVILQTCLATIHQLPAEAGQQPWTCLIDAQRDPDGRGAVGQQSGAEDRG